MKSDWTSGENNPRPRSAREQTTIAAVMNIYCRDHQDREDALCGDCDALVDYARRRLDMCPLRKEKPARNHCTFHCCSQIMHERRKTGMRCA
jgi:hypothetical protein